MVLRMPCCSEWVILTFEPVLAATPKPSVSTQQHRWTVTHTKQRGKHTRVGANVACGFTATRPEEDRSTTALSLVE